MTPQAWPAEWRTFTDQVTGTQIVQWTSHASMNHHLYFTNPTTSGDGRHGYFVSYRTGYPNLFQIDLASGSLLQLTARNDINPYSFAPQRQGESVFFTARESVFAVSRVNGKVRELAKFAQARLAICNVSHDDRWLAVALRFADHCSLAVIDLMTNQAQVVSEAEEIGHVQFCPQDPSLIQFSGSVRKRIWLHDRTTRLNQLIYDQPENEWIVHESWLGRGDEIIFVKWPYSLCAIPVRGGEHRVLSRLNAWHICSNTDGTRIICDTVHPDRGLIEVDVKTGGCRTVCLHGATARGTQWKFDHPAVGAGIDTSIIRSATPAKDAPPTPDDPPSTYGPQWSHPHPRWTTDEEHVVFTSDRGRWSQVYMARASHCDSSRTEQCGVQQNAD